MKIFIPFQMITLISNHSAVFADEYTQEELQNKISGYSRMRRAGKGLLIGGIILDIAGPVALITGVMKIVDYDYSNNKGVLPDGLGLMYAGAIGLGFGVTMTAGGIVLSVIGNNKVKEYRNRLEISYSINSVNLTITF